MQNTFNTFDDNLEGGLDLNTFLNLEELTILSTMRIGESAYDTPQNITSLQVKQCSKLKKVYLENGKLENLDFSQNAELNELIIHDQKQLTSLKVLGSKL